MREQKRMTGISEQRVACRNPAVNMICECNSQIAWLTLSAGFQLRQERDSSLTCCSFVQVSQAQGLANGNTNTHPSRKRREN